MAEFCTLDELKLHPSFRKIRAATVDVADEEFYQLAIKSVSSRFEKKIGRRFTKDTYTEYFSPAAEQSVLQLHALPIASVTSVKESSTSDFSTAAAMSTTSYGVDTEAGILKLRYTAFLEGFNTVQVVYVGGFDPIPDDIKFACILQAGHEIELASKSGLQSQGTGNSSASYTSLEFLPAVNSILSAYAVVRL